jgi:hypothetical protein
MRLANTTASAKDLAPFRAMHELLRAAAALLSQIDDATERLPEDYPGLAWVQIALETQGVDNAARAIELMLAAGGDPGRYDYLDYCTGPLAMDPDAAAAYINENLDGTGQRAAALLAFASMNAARAVG